MNDNQQKCSQCQHKAEKCRDLYQSLPDPIPCADYELPRIIIDIHEHALIALFMQLRLCYFEVEELGVGDIICSDRVTIERKAKDFIPSLIRDKKLWRQLYDLKNSCTRPIFLLEGYASEDEAVNLISLERHIATEKIQAIFDTITCMGISTKFTISTEKTAQWITAIATREQFAPEQRWFGVHESRTRISPEEQLVRFMAGLSGSGKNAPGIGQGKATVLLNHFNTIKDIANTDKNTIKAIPTLGESTATLVVEFFSRKYKRDAPNIGGDET